jgi:hypothetical protein
MKIEKGGKIIHVDKRNPSKCLRRCGHYGLNKMNPEPNEHFLECFLFVVSIYNMNRCPLCLDEFGTGEEK